MTARHEIRVGNRRLGRGRHAPIDATPAPPLGDQLRAARERKGVDLYRAERDTKIRAKYLAALEESDFAGLPGAVYTKGFLRNYAVYLGLDPDEMIARWREEALGNRPVEPRVPVAPPRPMAAPRRGLTFTPGLFVAVALTLVLAALLGYIVIQLFRFTAPELSVTYPATSVVEVDAETITLQGTSAPGATITITGAGDQVFRPVADANGRWSREVPLTKGQNDFTIYALDPGTRNESPRQLVRVVVPLPASAQPGEQTARPVTPAAALTVSSPADGATIQGPVALKGTTDAQRVTVTAQPAAVAGASPGPTVAASPTAGSASPTAGASPAAPRTLALTNGAFDESLQLAPGRWQLTVTAEGTGRTATTTVRTVTVEPIQGVQLRIDARSGAAWIKVWLDGQVAPGYGAGQILRRGGSAEFTARRTITVRTGNSGATVFTVNGEELGSLGRPGVVESWTFEPPKAPRRVP